MRSRIGAVGLIAALIAGLVTCATPRAPPQAWPRGAPALDVIAGGWHTEIALPAANIRGPLAALKADFSGARYLVFGWGARGYYMAQHPGLVDLLRAIAPGPAVVLVIPLQVPPVIAFGAANMVALPARRDELARLDRFLWASFAKRPGGRLSSLAPGPWPHSRFYAARGTYSLDRTCNTWTAQALAAAGLPVNADGVVFAHQVLDQLTHHAITAAPVASSGEEK